MPVRVRTGWIVVALLLAILGVVATWYLLMPVEEEPDPSWVASVGVLAGTGVVGWADGPAHEARFSEPFGIAAASDGVTYVSDAGGSHRIRRLSAGGIVTTVAGGGEGFVDGNGTAARFSTPSGLALTADHTIVIADTGNHAIRRVSRDGRVSTLAGDGLAGDIDGPAARARFNGPIGVAIARDGRVIVADTYNDRIRVIESDGHVRTLAGGAPGNVDGSSHDARFDTPCGVAIAPDGRILVADTGNGAIRSIAPDGQVTTVTSALLGLERPIALSVDALGDVYVADERGDVMVLPARGDARLLAGSTAGYANGVGSTARFRRPSGIALASERRLVVADAGNALVRELRAVPAPAVSGTAAVAHAAATQTTRRRTTTRLAARSSRWFPRIPALFAPASPLIAPAFDAEAFARTPLLWPIAPLDGPHEVAGTFGEARGEPGQERFHAGIDVRAAQGTLVRAVRDGTVSSPISTGAFDTLNEWLRIGPLTYVHIRAGRMRATRRRVATVEGRVNADVDPQRFAPVFDDAGVLSRLRVMRGARFTTGEMIGSINRFNHVHVNIGWPGEEHNPLRFGLVQFVDTVPPTIAAHGIRLFDEAGQPLNPDRIVVPPSRPRRRARRPRRLPPSEPVVVRGPVQVVVDAWDQAEGNIAARRLGLYSLAYQLVDRRGTPVAGFEQPRETIRFDRLRRDAEAARDVFASGSGIPVYGTSRTRFLYVVTTTFRDGVATRGVLDPARVPPGEYVLRVFARDFHGNTATANRDLAITVVR